MASFTTQARVKRALGIPSAVTTHDTFIDELLTVADAEIIAYCGMAGLTETAVVEKYDIPDTYSNQFTLRNFPVSSITYVTSSGATLSESSYYLESRSGTLKLSNAGRFFPEGRQKVVVSYTYGYSTAPADLARAATIITASHFNRTRHSGMQSEGVGGYRYRVSDQAVPSAAQSLLAKYKRLFPKEAI